jgi:Fur family ferric uptake transcriptional regulator
LDLTAELKKAGYKITEPRRAVIEVLETNSDHLSHQQILDEARKLAPKLGRATVYRTLDLLVELKLIRPLYLGDATQRFIDATGNHHHLVCSDCGAIFEFDYCTVDQLAHELSEKYNFQIHNHLLEFQGLCDTCH